MIIVQCECGKRLQARDDQAGARARCPQCQRTLIVPSPDAPAAQAPPQAQWPQPAPQAQPSAWDQQPAAQPATATGEYSSYQPSPAAPAAAEPAGDPAAGADPVAGGDARQWYYVLNGQRMGPLSGDGLVALLRGGQLNLATNVWTDGMAAWQQAGTIPELVAKGAAVALAAQPYMAQPQSAYATMPTQKEGSGGRTCGILSIIFGAVALLLCPPLFGLAGLVLGIVSVSISRNKRLGTIGIIVSVIGIVLGMIIGVLLQVGMSSFD